MADRPILYSAPMVRALLDGRKTQTRRVLPEKYRGVLIPAHEVSNGPAGPRAHEYDRSWPIRTPYAVGDRLWVRETWQGLSFGDYVPTKHHICDLRYAATDPLSDYDKDVRGYPWRPSIHMPRWASRLTQIVTDVRVQRLQEISEADAIAEGIEGEGGPLDRAWYDYESPRDVDGRPSHVFESPIKSYASLWDTLHKPGTRWADNPWVIATTGTVHHCNIDQLEAA